MDNLPVFLPTPQILRGYQEVDGTLPDAYLQLVWEETLHRRRLERLALDAGQRRASRSQWFTQGSMLIAVLTVSAVLLGYPGIAGTPQLVGVLALLCITWGVPLWVGGGGVRVGRGRRDEQAPSQTEGLPHAQTPREAAP